ncbi:Sirohydrochlorin cobaltochelatase [bioreactor metagenome]|uniref:Sirohydrochlorin cobaltochelatase n=1 Tax=bioreactor metagenome TaxID=1076179 RepID=A0A644TN35_9ZZZZ|nr:sirohydrochlorin cobaltochelatase [Negativicutes bacterium]
MKKTIWFIMTAFLFTISFGIVSFGQKAYAAAPETGKKAILVVSFGTTYPDTRKLTIESVESKIQAAFPDYEVRRAFTSRIIIKKLAERDSIQIDNEQQALERLKAEGYKEVIVQPLHIEAGAEYEKVRRMVSSYAHSKAFDRISLGRPILYYMGQEEKPDDYAAAIEAIKNQMPELGRRDAIVFMGHGGVHPSNAAYAVLQMKIADAGLNNVFIYTVESYPMLDQVVDKLKANKIKKVTLMPFMLVAGDHATNDMAGDEEDSAKSQLLQAGFKVDTYVHGLGENAAIQDIYVQHVQDAIDQTYEEKHE